MRRELINALREISRFLLCAACGLGILPLLQYAGWYVWLLFCSRGTGSSPFPSAHDLLFTYGLAIRGAFGIGDQREYFPIYFGLAIVLPYVALQLVRVLQRMKRLTARFSQPRPANTARGG